MDDATGMGVGHGATDLQQEIDRLIGGELAVPRHVLVERERRIRLHQTTRTGLVLDVGLVRPATYSMTMKGPSSSSPSA